MVLSIDADAANDPGWSQILRICWASRPLGMNIGSAGVTRRQRRPSRDLSYPNQINDIPTMTLFTCAD
jgi:hypothetical protein